MLAHKAAFEGHVAAEVIAELPAVVANVGGICGKCGNFAANATAFNQRKMRQHYFHDICICDNCVR